MAASLRILATLLITAGLWMPPESVEVPGSTPHPVLPAEPFNYSDPDLPRHFTPVDGRLGRFARDNTPDDNPITDHGATLGRVLFYDTALSANDSVACASCHVQEHGFSDPRRFSIGLDGEATARHSMGLANARYYSRGRFFWDERAATLEEQVLMPIQDPVEMGLSLDDLESKLASVDYYPALFESAFGTPEIDRDRISRALAQFVRSLVSYDSKYDRALSARPEGTRRGTAGFRDTFTEQELLGLRLFGGTGRGGGRGGSCAGCHTSALQLSSPRNNGLDAVTDADEGAGRGAFKAPSLRNVAVRAPYMHDGRFSTLREVVEHYNSGVQAHPNLSRGMRSRNGEPRRLNLSEPEIDALVAFLETLTDETFLADPKFSDPFRE